MSSQVVAQPSQLQQAIAGEMGVDFNDYGVRAGRYLSRPVFKGTPLTGDMLRMAAQNAYNKYGVMVPLELALAQAQFESGMGRKGRNPLTNPYNVGEYDAGTKMRFKDTSSGVNAYYDLMARDYLKKNTMDGLLKNFVNYQGNRYASNPQYEKVLSDQVGYINKFFGNGVKASTSSVNSGGTLSFGDAFKKARSSGLKTFEHNGKLYTTETK